MRRGLLLHNSHVEWSDVVRGSKTTSIASIPSSSSSVAELDLITDVDMYLMVENNMRGGIATISQRYARANNPLVEGTTLSNPTVGSHI